MKLEDYNMINNYFYNKINNSYLLLNHHEKLQIIHYYLSYLCNQFMNDGFIISRCDNNGIIFRVHIKKTADKEVIKWFDYNVNELLMRKRKIKLDKIISMI
jgi:hypothetical protein